MKAGESKVRQLVQTLVRQRRKILHQLIRIIQGQGQLHQQTQDQRILEQLQEPIHGLRVRIQEAITPIMVPHLHQDQNQSQHSQVLRQPGQVLQLLPVDQEKVPVVHIHRQAGVLPHQHQIEVHQPQHQAGVLPLQHLADRVLLHPEVIQSPVQVMEIVADRQLHKVLQGVHRLQRQVEVVQGHIHPQARVVLQDQVQEVLQVAPPVPEVHHLAPAVQLLQEADLQQEGRF